MKLLEPNGTCHDIMLRLKLSEFDANSRYFPHIRNSGNMCILFLIVAPLAVIIASIPLLLVVALLFEVSPALGWLGIGLSAILLGLLVYGLLRLTLALNRWAVNTYGYSREAPQDGQVIPWKEFELRALDNDRDDNPGWAWAEDKIAAMLGAIPNPVKRGDGGIDARYYGAVDLECDKPVMIPIQVKMHQGGIGRPVVDQLLGTQLSLQNQGQHAPMALMVTLYPSSRQLIAYARQQGQVSISTEDAGTKSYPKLQIISVQEMLAWGKWPVLPPKE